MSEQEQTASMIELSIDGITCTCEPGERLFDVARRNGIFIPTVCRHDGFEPRASCRVCIVEVAPAEEAGESGGESAGAIVASCRHRIDGPCAVATNSDRVRAERRLALELLARRAPGAELVSDLLARLDNSAEATDRESAGIDAERCVVCGLCVQACDAIGTKAIRAIFHGTAIAVGTPNGTPSKTCIGCLSCANVCPTDAISWSEDERSLTREIWGRSFDLVRCERCGDILGTAEEAAWAERGSANAEGAAAAETAGRARLCACCRTAATADGFLSGFRR